MADELRIAKKNEVIELNSASEKVLITAEENCSATIIDKAPKSRSVEIMCKKNSSINFLSVQDCSASSIIRIKKSAIAEDNAEINWIDCHFGGRQCSSETKTFLNGKNSFSASTCLFFGKNAQQFELSVQNFHNGKNTSSRILVKGVLDDSATALCRNLLSISRPAVGSDGIQKSEILLLNKNSRAKVFPELSINNNAKRCSHSVSISNVDGEKLFYLMSRGFSRKDSVKQLVEGFFSSALSGDERFASLINKLTGEKLK